jgi:hypothetical protein
MMGVPAKTTYVGMMATGGDPEYDGRIIVVEDWLNDLMHQY